MEFVIIENDNKCNSETSRLSYMRRITCEFHTERDCVLPTAAQERSFEDALHHLVRLFPNKRDTNRDRDAIDVFSGTNMRNGLKACNRKGKGCRIECLKEILNALQFMDRKRVYDPPADDEIRYYLLIKKYIRSMFTFFSAREISDEDTYGEQYECFSYSKTLHNMHELAEINRYLADFSAFVSEMDITNSSAIKPLMGIQENYEVAPIIRGSKERNTLFYQHKFELAFFDIRSSQYACFPPSSEEERSYLRVLDHISAPSISARDKAAAVNVYSEELHFLFLDRIEREIKDLERYCVRIKMSILEKLSLVESWESLVESYNNDPYNHIDENHEFEDPREFIGMWWGLTNKLAEKCQASKEDLPDYIASMKRCSDIACSVSWLITARANGYVCLDELQYSEDLRKFGWDALHALTLFKRGSFSPGNVFREHVILRNPNENVTSEIQDEEAKMKKRKRVAEEEVDKENVKNVEGIQYEDATMKKLKCVAHEEREKENIKILEDIVEDLRRIGDSCIQPDKEEKAIMYRSG